MAISSSALTMAQYAMLSNDPLVRAVTFSLRDNGSIMADDIPFVNKASLVANGVRWEGNLPSVNWANVNDEGTTVSGTPTPFQEQAYILRNYIDVDKVLVMDQNQIVDPRAAQVGAYLKSATYDFNDKFFNNNHTSGDAKAIVGIRARLDDPTRFGSRSDCKIDAGGVDMTTALTAATANTFIEYIEQLLWAVGSNDGTGVVLYMNEQLKRRFNRALRAMGTSGGLDITKDQFGRDITMFRGAQIKDPGYKADQSTRIITATETSAGANGNSNYTSVYAVHYGTEWMMGWQFEPLNAKDLGLQNNGVIYRTFIDWTGGLYSQNTRSIGRLYDIKVS